MDAVRPAYFYELGFAVNSVMHLSDEVPSELRIGVCSYAWRALDSFAADENIKEMLPQASAKAVPLVDEMRRWATATYPGRIFLTWEEVRRGVERFSTTITDELERTHNYVLTDKGSQSIHKLIDGISKSYPQGIVAVVGSKVRDEIDASGVCLACNLCTACGFHILRSVELCIMAYVVAVTGHLPNPQNRSWSTYIRILTECDAGGDLLDVLKVLKTKRNPLMHPEEILDVHDAIHLLSLSEATICALVEDVKRGQKVEEFLRAVGDLPELAKADRAKASVIASDSK